MKKLSKNCYQGGKVKNINVLYLLAKNGNSIYHPIWGRRPAGFIINMRMAMVLNEIKQGRLYHVINIKKEN